MDGVEILRLMQHEMFVSLEREEKNSSRERDAYKLCYRPEIPSFGDTRVIIGWTPKEAFLAFQSLLAVDPPPLEKKQAPELRPKFWVFGYTDGRISQYHRSLDEAKAAAERHTKNFPGVEIPIYELHSSVTSEPYLIWRDAEDVPQTDGESGWEN